MKVYSVVDWGGGMSAGCSAAPNRSLAWITAYAAVSLVHANQLPLLILKSASLTLNVSSAIASTVLYIRVVYDVGDSG